MQEHYEHEHLERVTIDWVPMHCANWNDDFLLKQLQTKGKYNDEYLEKWILLGWSFI